MISKGLPFSLCSGALWGALLVVPQWLSDFSVTDITVGRFLAFAGVVLCLLIFYRRDSLNHLKPGDFQHYLLIALFGNLFFYFALIASIRHIGAVPACIMMGALPVLGWKYLDSGFRINNEMMPPVFLLVLAVLLAVSESHSLMPAEQSNNWLPGIMLLLLAAVCWIFSATVQANMVRSHSHLDHSDHFLLTGVLLLPCLLIFLPLLGFDDPDYGLMTDEHSPGRWHSFWLVMLGIGFFSTLVARIFWKLCTKNEQSHLYHYHAMWQSVFGLFYIFVLEQRLPEGMELASLICFGFGLFLYGRHRSENQCLQA